LLKFPACECVPICWLCLPTVALPRLKLGAVTRRCEFIISVGSVAAWPLTARGQQSYQMRRIGVLLGSYTESDKAGQARIAAFLKTLADLGWNTDRNIRIEYRWAAGDTEQTKKLDVALDIAGSETRFRVGAGTWTEGIAFDDAVEFILSMCGARAPRS
jgi:hypothetical protein